MVSGIGQPQGLPLQFAPWQSAPGQRHELSRLYPAGAADNPHRYDVSRSAQARPAIHRRSIQQRRMNPAYIRRPSPLQRAPSNSAGNSSPRGRAPLRRLGAAFRGLQRCRIESRAGAHPLQPPPWTGEALALLDPRDLFVQPRLWTGEAYIAAHVSTRIRGRRRRRRAGSRPASRRSDRRNRGRSHRHSRRARTACGPCRGSPSRSRW